MSRRYITGFRGLLQMQGVLLGLILLMFLIYFVQEIFGEGLYYDLMVVPAKVVGGWHHLLAGTASVRDWGAFGTMLSSAFLHGSIEHVGFNMIYFWLFGALLVELIGWRWMLLIFLLTAFSGSLMQIMMHPESYIPGLGASGGVMGFEGAYLGLAVRWILPNPHVWPLARPILPSRLALMALIGVVIDYSSVMQGHSSGSSGGTAYGAHIGGFTMGLLLAATLVPMPRLARGKR